MAKKLYPQLVEIDPDLIKFNPTNPRRHHGSEYLRLKKSITEVGMVQLPTVRVIAGGFYECIDGEGRVRIAQEAHLPTIWVISLDIVDDPKASTMLQAANAIREFNFLAECRGLANLHRQGMTSSSLADKFGLHPSLVREMVGVGYFPENLFTLIQEATMRSEEQASRWTQNLFRELLPLRQERPKQETQTIEGPLYDYTEVRRAVDKVLRGEITAAHEMIKYVAERRLALYQERFDQELHGRLEAEIIRAKQALEESYRQQTQKEVQEKQEKMQETIHLHEEQSKALRKKLNDLEERHKTLAKEVAKRPAVVEQLENELKQKMSEAEQKRLELQETQKKLDIEKNTIEQQQQEAMKQQQEAMKQQLATEKEKQQEKLDQEYQKTKEELVAYYAKKDRDREIQTEKTMYKIVANCTRQLAESQVSVLHVLTPDILSGIARLKDPAIIGLLAQIRSVRETLEMAEERLLYGNTVASSEAERRAYDGSSSQHH